MRAPDGDNNAVIGEVCRHIVAGAADAVVPLRHQQMSWPHTRQLQHGFVVRLARRASRRTEVELMHLCMRSHKIHYKCYHRENRITVVS